MQLPNRFFSPLFSHNSVAFKLLPNAVPVVKNATTESQRTKCSASTTHIFQSCPQKLIADCNRQSHCANTRATLQKFRASESTFCCARKTFISRRERILFRQIGGAICDLHQVFTWTPHIHAHRC